MKKGIFMSILIMGTISQAMMAQGEAATDSTNEITVSYRMRNNLLVIPFMINESLKVNLLVDPRCKNVILFGKRYERRLRNKSGKDTYFPVRYDNKISIGPASADNVPIAIVPNISLLNFFTSVNGVIGSDFLSDYELTIHESMQTITIRSLQKRAPNFTTRKDSGYRFEGLNVSN